MPKYIVQLPIAGTATFYITAPDEDTAIELALQEEVDTDNITFEVFDNLMVGFACNAPLTEPSVEEDDNDDEPT